MKVDNIPCRTFYTDAGKGGCKHTWNIAKTAMARSIRAAGAVLAETVWPSRCAVCGVLGAVLCEACKNKLPYIDQWLACPHCGAPYGLYQCCECNTFSLSGLGRKTLPFDQGVSAVAFTDETARIVRIRKDQGERALAAHMAYSIACAIPPSWLDANTCVTYPPSTVRALQMRGFCHTQDLARNLARILQVACVPLLASTTVADQRLLNRAQRSVNAQGRFSAQAIASPCKVIVVDDVYTTGSTVMAAADALKRAGAEKVFVATFARV